MDKQELMRRMRCNIPALAELQEAVVLVDVDAPVTRHTRPAAHPISRPRSAGGRRRCRWVD